MLLHVRNIKRYRDQQHVLSQQNVEDWSNEKNKNEIGKNKLVSKKKNQIQSKDTLWLYIKCYVTYQSFL